MNPHTGTIKLNFPELEVWELADSCALDIAERGGTSLDDISKLTEGDIRRMSQEIKRTYEANNASRVGSLVFPNGQPEPPLPPPFDPIPLPFPELVPLNG